METELLAITAQAVHRLPPCWPRCRALRSCRATATTTPPRTIRQSTTNTNALLPTCHGCPPGLLRVAVPYGTLNQGSRVGPRVTPVVNSSTNYPPRSYGVPRNDGVDRDTMAGMLLACVTRTQR